MRMASSGADLNAAKCSPVNKNAGQEPEEILLREVQYPKQGEKSQIKLISFFSST
jgi:hypothetical protein